MIPLPSDSRKYTPQTEVLVASLNGMFPDIGSMGIYNRRKISGSLSWSQHAWGAAADITSPRKVALVDGRIVRNTRNPAHMRYLDEVRDFLRDNQAFFGIRNILWRQRNHWNHIHADFNPKQRGTPPILGARPTGDDDMFKEYLTEVQKSLNDAGFKGANDRPLSVDGILGRNTISAMRDRDQASTKTAGLSITTERVDVVRSVRVI